MSVRRGAWQALPSLCCRATDTVLPRNDQARRSPRTLLRKRSRAMRRAAAAARQPAFRADSARFWGWPGRPRSPPEHARWRAGARTGRQRHTASTRSPRARLAQRQLRTRSVSPRFRGSAVETGLRQRAQPADLAARAESPAPRPRHRRQSHSILVERAQDLAAALGLIQLTVCSVGPCARRSANVHPRPRSAHLRAR